MTTAHEAEQAFSAYESRKFKEWKTKADKKNSYGTDDRPQVQKDFEDYLGVTNIRGPV